jgi:hypothetical protein
MKTLNWQTWPQLRKELASSFGECRMEYGPTCGYDSFFAYQPHATKAKLYLLTDWRTAGGTRIYARYDGLYVLVSQFLHADNLHHLLTASGPAANLPKSQLHAELDQIFLGSP